MDGKVVCKACGASLGKGSTFCLKCGTRIGESSAGITTTDESTIEDTSELEDSTLESTEPTETELTFSEGDLGIPSASVEEPSLPPESEIGWEKETSVEIDAPPPDDILPPLEDVSSEEAPLEFEMESESEVDPSEEDDEGMPFKEIEPPLVLAEAPDETNEVRAHLFTEEEEHSATREAVQHLFPKGRGETSEDFIDIVVGKPKKIGITQQLEEFIAPDCPDCGKTVISDGFEYPHYVYGAMGKARVEAGIEKLKNNDHEEAIELFEKGKILYERAEDSKSAQECVKLTDRGYEAMAESHYLQGEKHLKEHEFEWAIVQFKKAREIYMFTTDSKKRGKSAQKARDCYIEWGKLLEHEGDDLAKRGESRDALVKYQQAAEKFKDGDEPKKLRGLEKKIRKA